MGGTCTHIYICMYVYRYVYTHIHIPNACMYLCMPRTYVRTYLRTYARTHACMNACLQLGVCVCMYTVYICDIWRLARMYRACKASALRELLTRTVPGEKWRNRTQDHIHTKILHSGSKAHFKGNNSNYAL